MIAPHFRESAGHLQAQKDALQKAVDERNAILDQQEAALKPIRDSRDDLLRRMGDIDKAMETLRAASTAPTLGERFRGLFAIEVKVPSIAVPPTPDTPPLPQPPSLEAANPPPFAETVVRLDEMRPQSEREKALAARGE